MATDFRHVVATRSAMKPFQAVVDTNVILSALRSKQGASYRLLQLVRDPRWRMHVSVALLLQIA